MIIGARPSRREAGAGDNKRCHEVKRSLEVLVGRRFAVRCSREVRAGISSWIRFCNRGRPHQRLGDRTPGVTGALAGNAVDMTLRLDDATASPTCPQRRQPQQTSQVA